MLSMHQQQQQQQQAQFQAQQHPMMNISPQKNRPGIIPTTQQTPMGSTNLSYSQPSTPLSNPQAQQLHEVTPTKDKNLSPQDEKNPASQPDTYQTAQNPNTVAE